MFARLFLFSLFALFAAGPVASQGDTKLLTIKGSAADDGATIQIPATAEVGLVVNADGIVITMPNLDLRLKCINNGQVTDDGYCYVGAGGGGGTPDDGDEDGVPDVWDDCPNTLPTTTYTNSVGCGDPDGDGVFNPDDQCPDQGGVVDETGCPPAQTTYTVSVSAGEGGSVSPAGDQTVAEGATLEVTITADAGYSYASTGGTCPAGSVSNGRYTTGGITGDCTLTIQFEAQGDTTAYCSGIPTELQGVVICDPDAEGAYRDPGGNLDPWATGAGTFPEAEVSARKILALPFTANAAGYYGTITIGTNMGRMTNGMKVRFWFSEVPGGDVITGGSTHCSRKTANPNPFQMTWTQDDGGGNAYECDLGTEERTLYYNIEVACFDANSCTLGERYNRDYFLKLMHGTPRPL